MLALDDTLDGTFPFAPHVSDAPGFRMHYVDEGPPHGPSGGSSPVLLVHGEPTWGYLFRGVIPRLARRYRVVAPDHMGFGKSDTPAPSADRPYTALQHVANLEALVLALDLRDITLVMHDWGGPIGTGLALRHPDRIARLVVTNSVVPLGLPLEAELLPKSAASDWFQWVGRLHAAGALETVLGELGATVLGVMRAKQGFVRTDQITDAWLRAYGGPFATPAECVGAVSFPRSIVTGEGADVGPPDPAAVAALRAKPALMVYGMRDRALLPEVFIPLFEHAFPGAPVYRLDDAGHFLYEDAPDAVGAVIEQFTEATGGDGHA